MIQKDIKNNVLPGETHNSTIRFS